MGDLLQPMHILVLAMVFLFPLAIALAVVPFWFICKKAGFSPWLSLLNLIPLGNTLLTFFLAFAEWKVVPAPPAYWQQTYPQQPPFPQPPSGPPQA
jgi:hypothetical protein